MKIPWSPNDAQKHKSGLSKEEKKKWAEIANRVYKDCMKNGTDKVCAPKAIKVANSKVGGKKNQEGDEMNKKTMKVPKGGFRLFTDEPSIDFKEEDENGLPTSFSMKAYTGSVMPDMWDGGIAVDVSGIDFSGKRRFPILEQHEIDKKIGVAASKPNTDGHQVFFEKIDILNNQHAQEFKQNLKDDFPYQASISIKPLKVEEVPQKETAEVNGKKFTGPGVIIRSSKFREASVCVFGRDDKTSVASLSEEDYEDMDVELIDTPRYNKRKPNGGKSMDLSVIKDDYPDLYKKIQADLEDKDKKITDLTSENETLKSEKTGLETQVADLTAEKENLSEENKESEKRIGALEKAEAKRREKDLKDQATYIIDMKLSASKIPQRLYGRIKKQLDHNDFVDENDVLDVEKFTEHVDAEITSWVEDLAAPETSATVLGISGGDNSYDADDVDSDKLSDELVAMTASA